MKEDLYFVGWYDEYQWICKVIQLHGLEQLKFFVAHTTRHIAKTVQEDGRVSGSNDITCTESHSQEHNQHFWSGSFKTKKCLFLYLHFISNQLSRASDNDSILEADKKSGASKIYV